MIWPEKLILTIREEDSNEPVPGLVVFVTIVAPEKNGYTMGPFLTESNGKVVIEKRDIEDTILTLMQQSPMDYSAQLTMCSGEIVVNIENADDLLARANRLAAFYPSKAEKLLKIAQESQNALIETFKCRLMVSKNIELRVSRTS